MRGWQFSIKMNFEFLSGPLNYSVRPEWHKQRQLCSTYHMMPEHFQNLATLFKGIVFKLLKLKSSVSYKYLIGLGS